MDKLPGGLSVFDVNIILKKEHWGEGVHDVWGLSGNKKNRIHGDELNRAKENYLSGMGAGYRERDKTGSDNYVNEYKRLFLENEASPGISWEYNFVKTHIGEIGLPELNQMAADWIEITTGISYCSPPTMIRPGCRILRQSFPGCSRTVIPTVILNRLRKNH